MAQLRQVASKPNAMSIDRRNSLYSYIRRLAAVVLLASQLSLIGACTCADNDVDHPRSTPWIDVLPGIYDRGSFKADPYIRAAARLQQQGEDRAVRLLSGEPPRNSEQVIVLARMLFKQRRHHQLNPPSLKLMGLIGFSTPEAATRAWPDFPLAIVEGVPFSVTHGTYAALANGGESGEDYIRRCQKDGRWRNYKYVEKTVKEKSHAWQKLISAPNWQRSLTEEEKSYLLAEIE